MEQLQQKTQNILEPDTQQGVTVFKGVVVSKGAFEGVVYTMDETEVAPVPGILKGCLYTDKSSNLHFVTQSNGDINLSATISGSYLPLIGGTMTGNINMAGHQLSNANIGVPTGGSLVNCTGLPIGSVTGT